MKNITIITPAWKRYDISEIVFQNFQTLKEKLNSEIDLNIIIIADDDNLKIAKKHSFTTVKTDNQHLGRRFNNGFEKALELGADFILPVGSDSLITKEVILAGAKLSKKNNLVFSTMHSMLSEDGKRIGCINTASNKKNQNKGALWFYERRAVINAGKRPCADSISSSCDRATIESIIEHNKNVKFITNNISYFQHLAIKSKDIQIWKYNVYKPQFLEERKDVDKILLDNYGQEILDKLNRYYGKL